MTAKQLYAHTIIRFKIAILLWEMIIFTWVFLIVFVFAESALNKWSDSISYRLTQLNKQNKQYSSLQ